MNAIRCSPRRTACSATCSWYKQKTGADLGKIPPSVSALPNFQEQKDAFCYSSKKQTKMVLSLSLGSGFQFGHRLHLQEINGQDRKKNQDTKVSNFPVWFLLGF
ncbi:uncharacterized protein RHO17_013155 isoform 4-T4 [Thomomys bottae]